MIGPIHMEKELTPTQLPREKPKRRNTRSLSLPVERFIYDDKREFDISQYSVQFNSIFEVKEMSEVFYKHLEKEFNTDCYIFMINVQQFKQLTSGKEILKKFFTIYSTFVEVGSPQEINVEAKKKQKFKKETAIQFENPDKLMVQNIHNVYDVFYSAVNDLLLFDSFPRFVRTDECRKVVEKYVNDPRVLKLIPAHDFPYTDKHFQKKYITEFDIKFSRRVFQDNFNWILLASEPEDRLNTFYLKENIFPDVSYFDDSRMTKFEGILPGSIEECFVAIGLAKSLVGVDHNIVHIGELENQDFLELKKNDEKQTTRRGNSIIEMFFEFGKIFKTRYQKTTSTIICEDNSIIRISKPYIEEEFITPENIENTFVKNYTDENNQKIEKKCHYFPSFTIFKLTKLSSETTHYSYIVSKIN